ncbi:hypothetical protein OJ997_06645 [Solirubrobacter phytolaccae]|uniref:Uncharacterized protein n=1 Tax=Solirubrobacter phytolaccae TaxID=1404360 RepID=A0A9X3N996_9ACTN|nr:hypothetical protein [Solirubrobacter phytolaccae]MDA0179966.1 hypothetical protein [Solirubrobacter phytolaccae]
MKPQFAKVLDVVTHDGMQVVEAKGAIDLSGDEEMVDVWVKIVQPWDKSAHAKGVVAFGQGTKDLAPAPDAARQGGSERVTEWTADVVCAAGEFKTDKARAEATIIMRDKPDGEIPGMVLEVWWWEVVDLSVEPPPAQSAS